MVKLTREIQKIFATDAQSTQVTAFRTAGDVPTYTKDVSLIQNSNFTNGWLDADNAGNVIPYAEDMNGLFYTLSRNIAYINQAGIPEWSNAETYYENAMCMYSGVLYISLQDNNTNRQPNTQTSYWTPYASPVGGSVTGGANLGTGEGIYASTISGTINLKSLVAGSNITLTPSVDGTSITIDASNGGAITSVSWGDIQGSIANQSDLANALSQRGTLSGTNSWSGSNTFASIVLGSNDLATTLSGKQDTISVSSPLSLTGSAISISQASSSTDGYLSSTDWTSFNSKLSSSIFSSNNTWTGTNTTHNIVPEAGNTYDLGDSGSTWRDGWFGRQVSVVNLNLCSNSTDGVSISNCFYPVTGNWVYFTGGIPNNAGGGFAPSDDMKLNLGQSGLRWATVYSKYLYTDANNYVTGSVYNADIGMFWKYNNTNYGVAGYHTNFIPYGNNILNLGADGFRWKKVFAVSGTIDTSDRRTKDNIEPLENALDKVNSINVKSFVYKSDPDHIHYGFIAQDEMERNPELVYVPENYSEEEDGGELGVISGNIPYLALKAIQELSEKVSVLENKYKNIIGD